MDLHGLKALKELKEGVGDGLLIAPDPEALDKGEKVRFAYLRVDPEATAVGALLQFADLVNKLDTALDSARTKVRNAGSSSSEVPKAVQQLARFTFSADPAHGVVTVVDSQF